MMESEMVGTFTTLWRVGEEGSEGKKEMKS